MIRRRLLATALVAASVVVVPSLARAQGVAARGVVAVPRSSARIGGATEHVEGLMGGLALDAWFRDVTVWAVGRRGELRPVGSGSGLSLAVGDISLGARYEIRSWLGVEALYTARAFSSPAGRQRWDIIGAGAVAWRELGTPAARARVSLAYLPVVDLSTTPSGRGLATAVGVSVLPKAFPINFELDYRIERFFGFANSDRAEQFDALMLTAGVRVVRQNGRWKLGA